MTKIVAAGVLHVGQKEGDEYIAAVQQVLEQLAGSDIETKMSEYNGQVYVQYRVHFDEALPDIDKKMSQHFRARQTILTLLRENSQRIARQMERGVSMHDRKIS